MMGKEMNHRAAADGSIPNGHPGTGAIRDLDWWRSDDARDARVSLYVAALLWINPENRRQRFGLGTDTPEWPAVFYYDPAEDEPFWIECKSATHAKDFLQGCQPYHINAAARALA